MVEEKKTLFKQTFHMSEAISPGRIDWIFQDNLHYKMFIKSRQETEISERE